MNQSDKILITGGSGSLGGELINQLVSRGYSNIHVCIREESIIPEIWKTQSGLHIFRGDLLDFYWVQKLMEGADYVFNMAGATSSTAGSREKLEQSNIEITRTWVNAALLNKVKGFIHFSSAAALGRKKDGSLCTEKDSWQKNEVYSDYNKTKFLGELEAARGQAEGLPTIVLNPSNIVSKDGIIDQVCRSIVNNQVIYPVGSGGYVFIQDVAHFAIEAALNGLWGEKYIVSAENIRHKQIFEIVASLIGKEKSLKPMNAYQWRLLTLKSGFKSLFTAHPMVPSLDWYRMLQADFAYDNAKSLSTGLINYTDIKESLKKILQQTEGNSSSIPGKSSVSF